MELDETYQGREHSAVKHELLKDYLEKLLYIVGISGIKEITYVDCFSGPWADESEDLHGTSIAISLDIIKRVREGLAANNNIFDIKFRAIYVEKSHKGFNELQTYLDNNCPAYIEHHALKGDYSDLQEEILRKCGDGFAFFFIDPKGWTDVGLPRLAKLLRRQNSEYLITFMYDFLNRFLSKEELQERVQQLLGKLDVDDLAKVQGLETKLREDSVVRRYRENMKQAMGGNARSYHATVLNKDKDKTIYHMVYLTRHPKGVVEFCRISEKVEIFQRRVRLEKSQELSGQGSLLPLEDSDLRSLFAADIWEVKQFWLAHLVSQPRSYTETNLADWLEETSWLESDFQQAFGVLKKEGKVENLDDMTNRRRKRFVHFRKNERLRKCT